jgi:N-acyl-D-glutamate deacylase
MQRLSQQITALCGCLTLVLATVVMAQPSADYDVVITGGRVIDPATGLDAQRDIAIRDGKIVALSTTPLRGQTMIDASGLVVAPGFIDMHSHGQTVLAGRVQAFDGVTTALELESGAFPVAAYYEQRALEGRPINYGASVNWLSVRIATLLNEQPSNRSDWFSLMLKRDGWQNAIATPAQIEQMLETISGSLTEGALGVGFLTGYAPGSGQKEYYKISRLAAQHKVPTYTHARYLSLIEPASSFQAIQEIIAVAAATGVHAHIVHLNSISLRDIGLIAEMIQGAQQRGLRISTEAYPYGAGATSIGAAMFRGQQWRQRLGGVDASNFAVEGKRLSEDEFSALQATAPETDIVVHFLEWAQANDKQHIDQAIMLLNGVIASDGGDWAIAGKNVDPLQWPIPENASAHPRSASTYARFIHHYVVEEQKLSLLEAISKVSYLPATLLQDAVPAMAQKGRLTVGADADIVIFDLSNFAEQASFERPAQLSTGMHYVLVNGQLLIRHGELDTTLLPGQAIRNNHYKIQNNKGE